MNKSHQNAASSTSLDSVDFSLNQQFYHSVAPGPALRIGVMIDGNHVPAFARQILEDVAASNFARTICFIRNASEQVTKKNPKTLLHRIARNLLNGAAWRGIGYLLYLDYIDARFKAYPDPIAPVDCSDLMQNASIIDIKPIKSRFIDRFNTDDLSAIANQRLDVILRFGFRILHGPILTQARYGIWSYHHGDPSRYRGAPPYLWELIERSPTSGAVLQALNEVLDGGTVLAEAHFPTSPFPSVSLNGFAPYWSTTHFVIRCLNQLHSSLPSSIDALGQAQPLHPHRPIYKKPSNLDVTQWLATNVLKRVRRRLSRPAPTGPWRIALRKTSVPLYRDPSREALQQFKWLQGRPDGFWADPFVIDHKDSCWLFYEDFDANSKKACIAFARITESGDLTDKGTALERDFHLSYPHIFHHAGEVFMVPESEQNGTVDLYRARNFPNDWVYECTLLKIRAVDSTVFLHGGRWYMLSSPMIVLGDASITHVWSAPTLTGPWQLTYAPLCADVRGARGAGRVFNHGSELWRPTQDCSTSYGHALGFSAIDSLPKSPQQNARVIIEPSLLPNLTHIHTYNAAAGWEAIDGRFAQRDNRY
jgi:hypothetical protein